MNKLKAVLFDLDGTLINSEPIHAKAFLDAFNYFNIVLEDKKFENDFLGASDYDVWKAVLKEKLQNIQFREFQNIKNKYFLAILNELTPSSVSLLLTRGGMEFMQKLVKHRIKIGLVTASDAFQTTEVLKKTGLEPYLDVICTATDTFFSKPNPSPYFHAMRYLHVKTEDVIIFEDSYFGLSAAIQTGAQVIGLTTNPMMKDNQKFRNIKFINDFQDVVCQDLV